MFVALIMDVSVMIDVGVLESIIDSFDSATYFNRVRENLSTRRLFSIVLNQGLG